MKTYINIKILIILSIILSIAFAGCTTPNTKTVPVPGGEVNVVEGQGPDWCKIGTKMTQSGPTGEQMTFEVKGITAYNGQEVCESGATYNHGGQSISIIYYLSKEGRPIHMIMKDASGKIVGETDTNVT
jgi:hypothetical protein